MRVLLTVLAFATFGVLPGEQQTWVAGRCATAGDAEPLPTFDIVGPATVQSGAVFFLTLPAPLATPSDVTLSVAVTLPPGATPPAILPAAAGRQIYLFAPAVPGEYRLVLTWQLSRDRSEGPDPHGIVEHCVTVQMPQPPAPEPSPAPGPQPGPVPPSPFPGLGLRVLILYETSEAASLSTSQQAILFGKKVRDELEARCAAGDDNQTREYRIWDADIDASGESDSWKQAMKQPHQTLPWLLIGNGKTGYAGPLPATADEFLSLLARFADPPRP